MALILVVDDERDMRTFLEIFLSRDGHEVHQASDGKEAFQCMKHQEYDLIMSDLKMPGDLGGMEVLARSRELWPDSQVIIMTAFSTTETAISAMKMGAYDYIEKPFNNKKVAVTIEKALEKRTLLLTNRRLKRAVRQHLSFESIIGVSPAMKDIFSQIQRIADTRTSVLILGESGTGKEMVARALHYSSQRSEAPMVVVNCGAIPDNLMESELFGYVKGAFTGATTDKKGLFEAASGGTLFLDEIGELSQHLQVKLLRALQERRIKRIGGLKEIETDIRILAATNRDLEEAVRQGSFREDLYFRINVIALTLPPLRERKEDISLLAEHFLQKYNEEIGRGIAGFTPETLEMLESYDYPGNVRELENIVQRGVALEQSLWITPEALPPRVSGYHRAAPPPTAAAEALPLEDGFNLDEHLDAQELRYVQDALTSTQGNVTEAARVLGISFRAMRYKLSKHGIRKEQFQ
jgi:two-component system response regulator PilR (NtrC family)